MLWKLQLIFRKIELKLKRNKILHLYTIQNDHSS
jgi:hypothetical protein